MCRRPNAIERSKALADQGQWVNDNEAEGLSAEGLSTVKLLNLSMRNKEDSTNLGQTEPCLPSPKAKKGDNIVPPSEKKNTVLSRSMGTCVGICKHRVKPSI